MIADLYRLSKNINNILTGRYTQEIKTDDSKWSGPIVQHGIRAILK